MIKQELLNTIDHKYKQHNKNSNLLLSESTIKILHQLCSPENKTGAYRSTEAIPQGIGHTPPPAKEIDHFMQHFMNQLETSEIMFHPVEFASIAYKRLLDIYPFDSHNEETATLFLNLLLASHGYPVIESPSSLKGYEEAMEKARMMPFPDTNPLTILIATALCKKRTDII